MSRQIQIRRGTMAQHKNFTGAEGEITMDTTNKTLCTHDGETVGGIPLARADLLNVSSETMKGKCPKTVPNYEGTCIDLPKTINVWIPISADGYLYISCMTNDAISWLTTHLGNEDKNISYTTQVNSNERGFSQFFPVKTGQKVMLSPRGTTIQTCKIIPF